MNKNVVVVADFFVEQVAGGGELNNEELINILRDRGYNILKIQSHLVTLEFVNKHLNDFFIVSNFCNLSRSYRDLIQKVRYVIYEHDHKYIRSRNPASYEDFKAPLSHIINFNFYKNAIAVLCQSEFHKNIVTKNLNIPNVINLGGNLWSLEVSEFMRELSRHPKEDTCAILDSPIGHKNTAESERFCIHRNIPYQLISDPSYRDFLFKLSKNSRFLFLPKTPETLSRVVVEARMLGLSIMTNNLIGATTEEWFNLKGEKLIDQMILKRQEIADKVEKYIQISPEKTKSPKITILSTFHEGEEFLDHFLSDITQQTIFDECELIIYDAASPGNEQKIVSPYLKKYDNIIYRRFSDKLSITECFNKMIGEARGEYLTWAFIDDRKRKNCLETLFEEIQERPNIDLVYGNCIVTDTPNESFEETKSRVIFEHSQPIFSRQNMIKCLPGPMPLWRKTMHDVCGFFDEENCNFADDWELWLRAVSVGCAFHKVEEEIGLYLTGGRSQQKNNLAQRKEEAWIFYKYAPLFGENFQKFKPYFDQFI